MGEGIAQLGLSERQTHFTVQHKHSEELQFAIWMGQARGWFWPWWTALSTILCVIIFAAADPPRIVQRVFLCTMGSLVMVSIQVPR